MKGDYKPIYYEDKGCDLAPKCIECPFSMCRHDDEYTVRALAKQRRDAEIVELHQAGLSVDKLAKRFGLSKRSIWRIAAGDQADREGTQ